MDDEPHMDLSAIALSGLQSAQSKFEGAARQVVASSSPDAPADGVDLSVAVVEMLSSQRQFEATAQLMRTAEEMDGQIVNLLA